MNSLFTRSVGCCILYNFAAALKTFFSCLSYFTKWLLFVSLPVCLSAFLSFCLSSRLSCCVYCLYLYHDKNTDNSKQVVKFFFFGFLAKECVSFLSNSKMILRLFKRRWPKYFPLKLINMWTGNRRPRYRYLHLIYYSPVQ